MMEGRNIQIVADKRKSCPKCGGNRGQSINRASGSKTPVNNASGSKDDSVIMLDGDDFKISINISDDSDDEKDDNPIQVLDDSSSDESVCVIDSVAENDEKLIKKSSIDSRNEIDEKLKKTTVDDTVQDLEVVDVNEIDEKLRKTTVDGVVEDVGVVDVDGEKFEVRINTSDEEKSDDDEVVEAADCYTCSPVCANEAPPEKPNMSNNSSNNTEKLNISNNSSNNTPKVVMVGKPDVSNDSLNNTPKVVVVEKTGVLNNTLNAIAEKLNNSSKNSMNALGEKWSVSYNPSNHTLKAVVGRIDKAIAEEFGKSRDSFCKNPSGTANVHHLFRRGSVKIIEDSGEAQVVSCVMDKTSEGEHHNQYFSAGASSNSTVVLPESVKLKYDEPDGRRESLTSSNKTDEPLRILSTVNAAGYPCAAPGKKIEKNASSVAVASSSNSFVTLILPSVATIPFGAHQSSLSNAPEENIHYCLICKKPFDSEDMLKIHLSEHFGKKTSDIAVKCQICSSESLYFDSAKSYYIHLQKCARRVSLPDVFDCRFCTSVEPFDSFPFYNRHLLYDHVMSGPNTNTSGVCVFCGVEFSLNTGRTFMLSHAIDCLAQTWESETPPIGCLMCDTTAALSKMPLVLHSLQHFRRDGMDVKNSAATTVDTSSKSDPNLSLQRLEDNPEIVCPYCSDRKKFKRVWEVVLHLCKCLPKTYLRHVCPCCNSYFSNSVNLLCHVVRHLMITNDRELKELVDACLRLLSGDEDGDRSRTCPVCLMTKDCFDTNFFRHVYVCVKEFYTRASCELCLKRYDDLKDCADHLLSYHCCVDRMERGVLVGWIKRQKTGEKPATNSILRAKCSKARAKRSKARAKSSKVSANCSTVSANLSEVSAHCSKVDANEIKVPITCPFCDFEFVLKPGSTYDETPDVVSHFSSCVNSTPSPKCSRCGIIGWNSAHRLMHGFSHVVTDELLNYTFKEAGNNPKILSLLLHLSAARKAGGTYKKTEFFLQQLEELTVVGASEIRHWRNNKAPHDQPKTRSQTEHKTDSSSKDQDREGSGRILRKAGKRKSRFSVVNGKGVGVSDAKSRKVENTSIVQKAALQLEPSSSSQIHVRKWRRKRASDLGSHNLEKQKVVRKWKSKREAKNGKKPIPLEKMKEKDPSQTKIGSNKDGVNEPKLQEDKQAAKPLKQVEKNKTQVSDKPAEVCETPVEKSSSGERVLTCTNCQLKFEIGSRLAYKKLVVHVIECCQKDNSDTSIFRSCATCNDQFRYGTTDLAVHILKVHMKISNPLRYLFVGGNESTRQSSSDPKPSNNEKSKKEGDRPSMVAKKKRFIGAKLGPASVRKRNRANPLECFRCAIVCASVETLFEHLKKCTLINIPPGIGLRRCVVSLCANEGRGCKICAKEKV